MSPTAARALALLTSVLSVAPLVSLAAEPASPAPLELRERGRSGALRVAIVQPGAPLAALLPAGRARKRALVHRWRASDGQASAAYLSGAPRAPRTPGVWTLEVSDRPARVSVITPVRFDGRRARLNGYHIGRYPVAAAAERGPAYAPPTSFIEVTEHNQDTHVSENFQLRHFLTKDQADVWPKYVPLDLRLVDKLELVIQELRTRGFAARGLHVMSGYRTPQYNGPGRNGRARLSRHTYGDAADVWVDDDGDGQMDDLDGDGQVDTRDADVLAGVVEHVEARHPQLVGGHGVYKATDAHGPFVHVDVRGTPARWAER